MDVRELQAPLKERYRADPGTALITLSARADAESEPVACSVEVGRKIQEAQAHAGVGGPGTAPCSGDLLLGALAACAQITCQLVAASMGLDATIAVRAEGDLDLRGTLGVDHDAKVGFEEIRLVFEVDAPGAGEEELAKLVERTKRYCVVLQTLQQPGRIAVELA